MPELSMHFLKSFFLILKTLKNSKFGLKEYYWDVLGARPDVNWSKYPCWQIFYHETDPMGFDAAEEVYEKVFR
jgi:hypothetical protein